MIKSSYEIFHVYETTWDGCLKLKQTKKKIWGEISWIITSEPTSQFLWVSAFILKSLFFLLNDRFNEPSYESWNFNGFLIGTLFDGFWLLSHDNRFAQNVWTVVHLTLNFYNQQSWISPFKLSVVLLFSYPFCALQGSPKTDI